MQMVEDGVFASFQKTLVSFLFIYCLNLHFFEPFLAIEVNII